MSNGPSQHADGGDAPVQILWTEAEPARLERDAAEVERLVPQATYREPDANPGAMFRHGGWSGELPRWPFGRPEPEGLDELLGAHGLVFVLEYSAAHPMLPPTIYPVDPEPEIVEQTQATWHVAPGGSLCLLQSEGAWRPEASITELLMKAAGWRIEYALMKGGVIDRMTVNGIVSDPSIDPLVAEAAARGTDPHQSTEAGDDVPH